MFKLNLLWSTLFDNGKRHGRRYPELLLWDPAECAADSLAKHIRWNWLYIKGWSLRQERRWSERWRPLCARSRPPGIVVYHLLLVTVWHCRSMRVLARWNRAHRVSPANSGIKLMLLRVLALTSAMFIYLLQLLLQSSARWRCMALVFSKLCSYGVQRCLYPLNFAMNLLYVALGFVCCYSKLIFYAP